jgi:hypothetical protein
MNCLMLLMTFLKNFRTKYKLKALYKNIKSKYFIVVFCLLTISNEAFSIKFVAIDKAYLVASKWLDFSYLSTLYRHNSNYLNYLNHSNDFFLSEDESHEELVIRLTEWFNSNGSSDDFKQFPIIHYLLKFMPASFQESIQTDLSKNNIPVFFIFANDFVRVEPYSPFLEGNHYTPSQSEIWREYQKIKENHKFVCLDSLLTKDGHFAIQTKTFGSQHCVAIIISTNKFEAFIEQYGIDDFVELFKSKFTENKELIIQDIFELEEILQNNTFFIFQQNLLKHLKTQLTQLKKSKNTLVNSLSKNISSYRKNNILKGLSHQIPQNKIQYFQKIDDQKFMLMWERAQKTLNFKSSKKLLNYLKSSLYPHVLINIIINWDIESDFRKLSLLVPYFLEDYQVITHMIGEDRYRFENYLVSLRPSNKFSYSFSLLDKVIVFSNLLNILNFHYNNHVAANFRLNELIDQNIYLPLKELENKRPYSGLNITYLIDIFKHTKILDHFPNNLALKEILFLQNILDTIKNNPYSYSIETELPLAKKYILDQLNAFKSHELISEDSTLLSLINNVVHSLSSHVNSHEYETIFFNFEIDIRQQQAEFLECLSEKVQRNFTNVLFAHLIKEVFLKPYSIKEKDYPNSSIYPNTSISLWRISRLLHGIIGIKENLLPPL